MDYGTWNVFMYYKYSKQIVFMWEKQTPVGAEKDHLIIPFLSASISHTGSHLDLRLPGGV